MTAFTLHDADDAAGPGPLTARWRLPGGRAATRQVRRTVHSALHGWGLGPVAADLTEHLATLVHEFRTRTAGRARGPIDLRLELRASARLLLGEIRNASPPSPDPAHRTPSPAPCHGLVALTYGRRPTRNGRGYIHSFAWWQPEAVTADR